jgi:hypothetical protein
LLLTKRSARATFRRLADQDLRRAVPRRESFALLFFFLKPLAYAREVKWGSTSVILFCGATKQVCTAGAVSLLMSGTNSNAVSR